MCNIFWQTVSVFRAHGRGRMTDIFRQRLEDITRWDQVIQVYNLRYLGTIVWRTRRSSSTKYRNVQVRMTSTDGAHHPSLMDGQVYDAGIHVTVLYRASAVGQLLQLSIIPLPACLLQIRNVKHCVNPSVKEPPKHEGSLSRIVDLYPESYRPQCGK